MTVQALRPARFFLWYLNAFFKRHALTMSLCFTFGFLLTVFLLFFQLKQTPSKNEISIGMSGYYSLNNLPKSIQSLLSFGLTEIKDNGEITAKAADKFSVDNTGTLYEIRIKSNLIWHDSKIFTAEDVNYNFKEVEKKIIDQNTLQFHLKEPFSPFYSLLTQPLFKKGFIGLGSYKIGRTNFEGETIESLELLPSNTKEEIAWPGEFPPELTKRIKDKTKLVIKFYPTSEMVKKALKLGEISVAFGLENSITLSDKYYENIPITDYSHVVAIFLNTKDPVLKDKGIRQALAFSIPKDILENLVRATGPIPPISWAYNGKTKTYDEDLNAAKELLGKTNTASETAKIRIVLSTFPQFNELAKKIALNWQKLGLSVDVSTQTMIPPNYQALLFSQEIPSDPDQYLFWHSTQSSNLTGYTSARNDKLLEDARRAIDIDTRKQKYFDFQKYLVEDTPAIFLFYPTIYTTIRK